MKIALMMENSQAAKNVIVSAELYDVAAELGHEVFNVGMNDEQDHHLTYIHLGIMANLLLNSRAVDFVVVGCGTGQGALMSLNAHPGVLCGYCIDPADAFLFAQINNGNALSLPFAKGFGWGAELNVRYIFEKAFGSARGQGYPTDRAIPQQRNAAILNDVKTAVAKAPLEALRALPRELVTAAIGGRQFQECFFLHCQEPEFADYVHGLLS